MLKRNFVWRPAEIISDIVSLLIIKAPGETQLSVMRSFRSLPRHHAAFHWQATSFSLITVEACSSYIVIGAGKATMIEEPGWLDMINC